MNNPKISVIIPIYNVEEYLEECLESILNQSIIDDIEVIMIDDGSTDSSRYIIEKYALDYKNFYAYHKENEGQGIARNYGLKQAKGEYITFIDSDDYIPQNAYEELYNFITTNKNDIVTGRFNRFTNYNTWEDKLSKNSFKTVKENIRSTHIRELTDLVWDTISCNKIYKRKFLEENNIKFPNERVIYEDMIFTFKAYYLSKSIGILNQNIYEWRIRPNKSSSTQNNLSTFNPKSRFKILKQMKQFIDNEEVEVDITNSLYEKWLNHDLKMFIGKLNNYPKDYNIKLIEKTNYFLKLIPNEIKSNLNSYHQILYKMIENKDLESILKFAPLERELKDNPKIIENIKEEYKQNINFEKDIKKEELTCKVIDIDNDDENILVKFSEYLPYMLKTPHETNAKLIDSKNKEYNLEIYETEENKTIIIPLTILEKENSKIKITYKTPTLEKVAYLKNLGRKTIEYSDLDVDIHIGINRLFLIKSRKKNDNKITIENIEFKDKYFELIGVSTNKIKSLFIENVIDFKKINYPVEYSENKFKIKIPYNDIINGPIKKWELKTEEFNSIELLEKWEVLNERNKTLFTNKHNKILIKNNLYNIDQYINDLNKEIKKLKEEKKQQKEDIKKLTKKNRKLKSSVNAYKNKKVIKLADKTNKILHRD